MKRAKQYGFHTIEVALVILVLGVLGFAGYKVMQNKDTQNQTAITKQEVPDAPEIKDSDDLTTASATVDKLDASDSSSDVDSLEKELDSLE